MGKGPTNEGKRAFFSSALVDILTRPPKLSSRVLIRMVTVGILEANKGAIVTPMPP